MVQSLSVENSTYAAFAGHLVLLMWMRESPTVRGYRSSRCGAGASMGGHKEILKWMFSKGDMWGEECCAGAGMLHLFCVLVKKNSSFTSYNSYST